MERLKLCPFCGGEARTVYVSRYMVSYVECKICLASSKAFADYDEEASGTDDAIAAWNRRINEKD